jgi:hypothetical protein
VELIEMDFELAIDALMQDIGAEYISRKPDLPAIKRSGSNHLYITLIETYKLFCGYCQINN